MKRNIWLYSALIITLAAFMLTMSCGGRRTRSSYEPGAASVSDTGTSDLSEQDLNADAEAARREEEERQRKLMEEQKLAEAARQEEAQAAREMFVNEDILFAFDSAAIEPDAQEILMQKAQWLQENSDASIVIEGHCDNRGTTAYNLALGERRAEVVKEFLINTGIAEHRMTTISYGEERPLDAGENEEAWARNRRAHFIIE